MSECCGRYIDFADPKIWRVCPVCEKRWQWGMRCRATGDPFNVCGECRTKEVSTAEMHRIVADMAVPCD